MAFGALTLGGCSERALQDDSSALGSVAQPLTSTLQGEYFDEENFTGFKATRADANIDFNWGNGQPHPSIGADTFSVRWTGRITAPVSGTYRFFTHTYDGARLWIGGTQLIEDWAYDEDAPSATITLAAGQSYDFKMEHRETSGAAVAQLSWEYPGQAKQIVPAGAFAQDACSPATSGLTGAYFKSGDLTNPGPVRADANINFNWGNGQPDPSVPGDHFSVRWTGKLTAPVSGTYKFYPHTYDGARLWVAGTQIVEDWAVDEDAPVGQVTLSAGQSYDFKMEYHETSGAAVAQLSWEYPGQVKQIVPASAFTTTHPCGTPDPQPPAGSAGVIFRDDFESASVTCWANKGTCGAYSVYGPATIAENSIRRSGSKSVLLTLDENEDNGGGRVTVDEDHLFYRYYDYYDASFDFGAGMKIARFEAADPATQTNRFDWILVSAASKGSNEFCGTNDMGRLYLQRNGVTPPIGEQPHAFQRQRWISVEMEVKLNTGTAADGHVRTYVDGNLVVEKLGLNNVRNPGETMNINRVLVGGWFSNGVSPNPAECHAPSPVSRRYIDDVIVARQYIGPEPTVTTLSPSTTKRITFRTPRAGTTQVEYGLTESYGSSTPLDSAQVQDHTATLTNLTPGRTYHYRVKSTWNNGYQYVSPDYVFTVN